MSYEIECVRRDWRGGHRFVPSATALLFAFAIGTNAVAAEGGAANIALDDLTVPADRLAAGCVVSPAPWVRLEGDTFRGGLWANLPIPTNPWSGTDAQLLATIRERIDPALLPDGPPLSRGELGRFRMKLAEGVEAAYAAVYIQPGSENLIVVQALKFATGAEAVSAWKNISAKNPNVVRDASSTVVVAVSGAGECFETVRTYVNSLLKSGIARGQLRVRTKTRRTWLGSGFVLTHR